MLAERAFLHMGGALGEHALPKPKPRLLGGAWGEQALPDVWRIRRTRPTNTGPLGGEGMKNKCYISSSIF